MEHNIFLAAHNTSYNEYKTRNILSLVERVEVIREYDRHLTRPSLQSLAQKFDCSSKQIKNILLNRESILKSFKSSGSAAHTDVSLRDDGLQKRQEKINFLGKVMYEYIQRVLYYNYSIDDEKVRQKALQVKECIAVENFQPTYAWLDDFKLMYGIPAFDLETLRNNVVITEAKRPHLSAIDMIQFVSRTEQEEQNRQTHFRSDHNGEDRGKQIRLSIPKADINGNGRVHSQNDGSPPIHEPKIIYEVEDEEEDEELRKLNVSDDEVKHNNSTQQNFKHAAKRKVDSPFPDIESVDEALRHVKCLEEYAMLQDNYRAIGLLTQLEEIFKKQFKKK